MSRATNVGQTGNDPIHPYQRCHDPLARPHLRRDPRCVAARASRAEKPSLVGLTRAELGEALVAAGIVPERQAKMRAQQLWHWLYVRGVSDFAAHVQHLQGSARRTRQAFSIARPEIVEEQISSDGTRKWLFRFPPRGAGRPVEIETVYIPEEGRGTLCISSQVGCTLTCSFCHTGTQKLVRNLTAEEILAQLMTARDRLGDFPDRDTPDGAIVPAEGRKISNIVMMGMGEPLYNFEAVKKALLIASDGDGLSLSKRRITLSTSGVVPEIFRTGEEIGVMLAISLHATNDDLRDLLVPINKKYPLKELIAACRAYPGLSNAKRITFEYVMLKDVNDFDRGRQGADQAAEGHSGQDQSDPVQPVAGQQLPVLGLGDDREIRRLHQQCRLRLADPHAARPRHPRRLRPAQVRIRAHAEDRPAGAGSDDDRGARRGVSRLVAYFIRFAIILVGYAVASLAASAFLNIMFSGLAGLHARASAADGDGLAVFFDPLRRAVRRLFRLHPGGGRDSRLRNLRTARLAVLCAGGRSGRGGAASSAFAAKPDRFRTPILAGSLDPRVSLR